LQHEHGAGQRLAVAARRALAERAVEHPGRQRNQAGVVQARLDVGDGDAFGRDRFCRLAGPAKDGIFEHGQKVVEFRKAHNLDDVAKGEGPRLAGAHVEATGFILEEKILAGPLKVTVPSREPVCPEEVAAVLAMPVNGDRASSNGSPVQSPQ
jgi:hypothetical protein